MMFAAAILRYLDSVGLVTFDRSGASAFLEDMPDTPVKAVAAFTRPGLAETDSGLGYDSPAVQLLVRGQPTDGGRARSGYEWAVAIRAALHGLAGVTIAPGTVDECYVVSVMATQSAPINIGDDPDDRPRWSIEVRGEIHAPTSLRPLNG